MIDFQEMASKWRIACFGVKVATDAKKCNLRFAEESIELVQSLGATHAEILQVLDYVYGRPAGKPAQEVGGVMLSLAGLCQTNGLDMYQDGAAELDRVWLNIAKIREKESNKPKFKGEDFVRRVF